MTRRKQGLTRRDGGRSVYRQTLGLYPSSVDCRKVVDWVAWKDPGVAPGGSPLRCSSKGQELRLLALVGLRGGLPKRPRSGRRRRWRIRRKQVVADGQASGYIAGPRSLRLAVQDAALSRQKQGFDSPRECQ